MSQGPILLRPQEVPEDFICSICMRLPLEPVLLSACEHVFCKDCIEKALGHQAVCPIDRRPCTPDQVRPLQQGMMLYRIWSDIKVKCTQHENGCAWTGSMGDYSGHLQRCQHTETVQEFEEQIRSLRLSLNTKEEQYRVLRLQLIASQTRINELIANQTRIHELENQMLELRRIANESLFDGSYNFRRENVVKLSQLIAKDLENKPANIDANRIFNCVRNCYLDLERGYTDNPEFYNMDMRMLLSTCASSTWFTNRQRVNIQQWLVSQGWN